ncbi:hypothetical protein [Pseudoalteromonas mariniglutinosa]|uniref:hypothetical protein n=1 Tax=Pseudoalteromonas mariniglutinosa TaxID=206042 RepID=UPI00384EDC34
MKASMLVLLSVLLLQPLLDSFDVAEHNQAINHTAQLLDLQVALEEHCLANNDHLFHQSEHSALTNAMSDSAEQGHCHVCHSPSFYQAPVVSELVRGLTSKINLPMPQFDSALLNPVLRPPIASLLS